MATMVPGAVGRAAPLPGQVANVAPVAAPGRSAGQCASVDHRTLLFGSRLGKKAMANGRASLAARCAEAELQAARERCILEEQNEALTCELSTKVAVLKKATALVGQQTSKSVQLTEDLDADISQARQMLDLNLGRLKGVVKQASGRHMCSLVLFSLLLLLGLYMLTHAGVSAGDQSASTAFLSHASPTDFGNVDAQAIGGGAGAGPVIGF